MITKASEEKISQLEITPESMLELFQSIARDTKDQDLPSGTLVVPMYDEDSVLLCGEYAAELHFVVRRIDEQPQGTGGTESGIETSKETPS